MVVGTGANGSWAVTNGREGGGERSCWQEIVFASVCALAHARMRGFILHFSLKVA